MTTKTTKSAKPAVSPDKDSKASKGTAFAKLLETSEPLNLAAGELVDGSIIAKSKSELWIDLAGFATGYIPAREIGEGSDVVHGAKIGDVITASVVASENDEGYVILSIKRAQRDRTWVDLAKRFETKESFPARVVEANTGGLLIDVGGLRGFLPVSQLAPEHYPRVSGGDRDLILDKLNKFIGTDMTVQILDVIQDENKLILSEKLARTQETEASLSKYSENDVVKGKITGVVDFGAFVSFDGLEGLIHISEIDWNRVHDPREHLKVGQEVEAKIISIEGAKVSLSLKRLKDDPWIKAAAKYKPGQKVQGTISRVTPYGAFVQLGEEVSGLVHVSELSEEHVENPLDVVKIGDESEFLVLAIDPDAHRIALSIKALADPEAALKESKRAAKQQTKRADLSALSAGVLKKLSDAGLGDLAKLKAATLAELEAVPGIGAASAKKIKDTIG